MGVCEQMAPLSSDNNKNTGLDGGYLASLDPQHTRIHGQRADRVDKISTVHKKTKGSGSSRPRHSRSRAAAAAAAAAAAQVA